MFNAKQAFHAAVAVLGSLALSTTLMAANPTAQPVIVTNPVTVANPVTTVAVSGGQLAITNGPANPVPMIDNSPRAAFTRTLTCNFSAGASTAICGNFWPPANKRLVIEDVSFGGGLPSGQKALVSVQPHFDGTLTFSYFPGEAFDNGVQAIVSGGRTARIYADPTGVVQATAERNSTLGTGLITIHIWGRLVDFP